MGGFHPGPISCEPYISLPRTAPPEQLGQVVRSALNNYRPETPDPSDFKKVRADFLQVMGVTSNKRLQETTINCGVTANGIAIEFEPTHNGRTSGDSKGFQPITGTKLSVPGGASDAELGNTLVSALDLCTSIYRL